VRAELRKTIDEVYSLFGVQVYNQESFDKKIFQVDISQHKEGMYILKLIYGDQIFKEKVVYY